jgi:hypothetical protein
MPARALLLTALISSAMSALVAFAAGLLTAIVLLHAPVAEAQGTPAPAPVVRAERIEIVDTDGTVLARLGRRTAPEPTDLSPWTGGVTLDFLDHGGQPRAVMGLSTQDVPAVSVLDQEGMGVALAASSRPDGTPLGGAGLSVGRLTPPYGDMRASLIIFPDGATRLHFAGPDGRPRIIVGVQANGEPAFAVVGAPETTSPAPPQTGSLSGDEAGQTD